jgi:hypothetical protein
LILNQTKWDQIESSSVIIINHIDTNLNTTTFVKSIDDTKNYECPYKQVNLLDPLAIAYYEKDKIALHSLDSACPYDSSFSFYKITDVPFKSYQISIDLKKFLTRQKQGNNI